MGINILLIIVAAMLVIGAALGWKRGLLEGIVRILSSILGIFVLLVVTQGIYRYMKGSVGSIVITVLLLAVIGLVQKIVKLITNTFQLVRALSVGKLVDKLAGAVFGAVEALFLIWFAYLLIGSFDLFGLRQWVMEQTAQSKLLQTVYHTNYLVVFLQRLLQ